MGFGFGPGVAFMKAYKENLRKPKERKKLKDIKYGDVKDTTKLSFKKMSEAELDDFKRKFKEKQRRDRIKGLIVLLMITFVVLIMGGIFLFA